MSSVFNSDKWHRELPSQFDQLPPNPQYQQRPTHDALTRSFQDSLSQDTLYAPRARKTNLAPLTNGAWNSRSGLKWDDGFSASLVPPQHTPFASRIPQPEAVCGASRGPDTSTQDRSRSQSPIHGQHAQPPVGIFQHASAAATGKRRASGKDEFDGPHQLLPKPDDAHIEVHEDQLIALRISLTAKEQDDVLNIVNDRLSECAYNFIAKYQFPIPIEADKRYVRYPSDREWTEWCHLLKRLATKRRIPMRVLWNGQIKQFVTILENSLEMRHAAKHQSRPLKDDRNVLQLISAGLQVAKIVKDRSTMMYLDALYKQVEDIIKHRVAVSSGSLTPATSPWSMHARRVDSGTPKE